MIDLIWRYTLPAVYAVLPPVMNAPEASALLLAIGLQESQFLARCQGDGGPARGFWQFERAGLKGVLEHPVTCVRLEAACRLLAYTGPIDVPACYVRVEHNDVLAGVFARLLLWTLPDRLPRRGEIQRSWNQYKAAWRPGRPRPETWDANYAQAWDLVEPPALIADSTIATPRP